MRKVRSHLALLFVTSLIITGCIRGDAESGATQKEYVARKVTDGDTIELAGGRRVRYIGIDTPETMRRVGGEWMFDPEAFAVAAKDYNRTLVLGKKVTLEFDVDKEDKYGRWLAYVYVDGVMANSELIKEGYAMVYTFPPNVKYLDLFLQDQEEARRNKKGLWKTLKEISPDVAGDHVGKYRLVKGTVEDVNITPHKIFLNFGKDHTRFLTAVIFTRNLSLFTKQGIDPATYYKGKSVELVGKIEYQNGPQIIIDNPTQILHRLQN
ncbi:MAG: thermonuclease family protein [Candidatus Omnitrophota bacterium]